MTEPVEEYLDQLLLTLSGPPRQVRHTLAEVEAHLHDAVADAIAAGLSEQQAQLKAVRRIGSAHAVAGRTALFTRPTAAIARRTVLAGSLVAGVALIALGVSSATAWGLAVLRGGRFIEAPWPRLRPADQQGRLPPGQVQQVVEDLAERGNGEGQVALTGQQVGASTRYPGREPLSVREAGRRLMRRRSRTDGPRSGQVSRPHPLLRRRLRGQAAVSSRRTLAGNTVRCAGPWRMRPPSSA